ncbi:MAG: hypothetical protein KGR98_10215, partial [Verrucomicrobia bacterium]|nr:hypothetical protein [Verrucomicrobiota bacterium]
TNLDFPPGETFETVYVPILDDLKVTPNLTVNLALSNPTGGAVIGDQPTATLTIVESDSVVSFLSSYYSQVKNAPTKVADIDVLRQGGTNGTASVDFYTTTNGTAVAGTDYYPTNLTVVFNPGQTDVVVQVPIINNNLAEGNRTVGLLLTNAVNTTLVAPSNAVLTIIDTVNAPGQIAFMATNYTAYESGGYAYLTLVRTNGSSGSVSVGYYTVPGTAQPGVNYSDGSGTVTFIGGQTNAAIQIPLITSGPPQAPVSLTVGLTNATGGATLIAPTNAALTIVDDLSTGFGFLNVTNYVRETNGVAPIFVQRLGNTNGSVQVNYATTNGTAVAGVNYVAASNILTFNPGQTLKAVSLQLIHDPQVTGDLKMMMRLSNPSAGTQLGLLSNTVVVIQDADAGFSFSNANLSVPKNAGFATIEVICSNPGIEPPLSTNVTPLSVQYYTADGSATAGQDYQAVNGTILFTNGIGTNIVNVPVINNSLITGTRTFTIHMANPTAPGQLIAPATETVSIVDNNSGLAFSRPSYNVARNAGMAAITVVRLDNLDTNSTVDYAASNGTAVAGMDYTPVSGTLVFTNGQASATFSVPVLGNSVVQPDRTVLLQLSSPVNGFLTAPYAATLTIYDTSGSLVVPAGSTLVGESFAPPNGIIDPGETVTNLFAFRAAGGTNVANLVAALLATNGVLFPSGPQSYGPLIVGGPSAARPFSFTANGTNGQQIIASFKLQDGTNDLGIASFSYMLGKWTTSFTNPAPIIINDIGIATPYPSGITVSNVGGTLLKATVTVTNLNHTWPSDIDMLLVSPAAQDALFM